MPPAIKGAPQIILFIASPPLDQPYQQSPKKDRKKLHSTWVPNPRRRFRRQSLRDAAQLAQRRPTILSAEGARGDSSRSYLAGPQRVRTPHASKKRKRKEGEEKEKDQPTAKRHNTIPKETQSDPPENNAKKASGKPTSERSSVPAHISNISETSSTPFDSASDPPKPHDPDTERPFNVEDVESGAAILAVITDICNNANGKLSSAEQLELRSMFNQMPKLLTREQREVDPEKAYEFIFAIYENPEAVNWGDMGALDDLETKLELLERFDGRAEASPKRKGGVYVV
ncbi:hypothetical protein ACHAPU_008034 [Fusarium lateritium]